MYLSVKMCQVFEIRSKWTCPPPTSSRWTWSADFLLCFLPPLVLENNLCGWVAQVCYMPDAISVTNQQRQSTEAHSKHWFQPVAWPHPFFIYHRTPKWTGIDPFFASSLTTVPTKWIRNTYKMAQIKIRPVTHKNKTSSTS